jgi:gliding motility-associated-like protein
MYRFRAIYIFCITILCGSICDGQVIVSQGKTAQELAEMLGGRGVTVSNPVLLCPNIANGTFRATNTNLGLDSGVLLTSGRASAVPGNHTVLANVNNNSGGDADLSLLAGQNTMDACILEFDFIPTGDSVKFEYVFSSEEYINATCGPYNDVFGFFISGFGIPQPENIALVPGTNIPVAINSINSGVPGSGFDLQNCEMMGPGSPFVQYYVNNSGNAITHKGFTTVLKAEHIVTPCSTYHLRLAIADAGNALYDSGIFLKAGSLQTNSFSVRAINGGKDTTVSGAFAVKNCQPGTFVISRPQAKPQAQLINYVLAGTAVNGSDYSLLTTNIVIPANETSVSVDVNILPSMAGVKEVTIKLVSPYSCDPNNPFADSATLMLYDTVYAAVLTDDTTICRFQSLSLQTTGTAGLQYLWGPSAGLSSDTASNPVASPVVSSTYIMRANWPGSGCNMIVDSVIVDVLPVPYIELDSAAKACVDGVLEIKPVLDPDSPGYVYNWQGPGGFSASNLNLNINNVEAADSGKYILTVGVNNGCPAAKDSVHVFVVSPPPAVSLRFPMNFCEATVEQFADTVTDSLRWYTQALGEEGTALIPITDRTPVGFYQLYVSNVENGCEGRRTQALINVEVCCEENIYVPNSFSPNNDGKNDKLSFTRSPDHFVREIKIFNRWGEQVFQSGDPAPKWDGNYKGKPAEAGYYYFMLLMECNAGKRISKQGEIMLIR